MSLESLCTVFLNPVIVIRESGFKPLVSMVNLTVPGISRIQNLLLRGDMTSPLNTISPRPSANVDASSTNGESVGSCYPDANIHVYLKVIIAYQCVFNCNARQVADFQPEGRHTAS